MLKHPELTVRRVKAFLQHDLQDALVVSRAPLTIDFCSEPHASEKEAAKGPWAPVESGFQFGPAYKVFWFRLKGTIPKEWSEDTVRLVAELGCERTLWRKNSPWCGMDGPHDCIPLGSAWKPGDKFECLVQAYTGNPQVSVYHRSPGREPLVAKVGQVELRQIRPDVQALAYDVEFALDLLEAFETNQPLYATVLRALNSVCNLGGVGDEAEVARARKYLRDAYNSLPDEIKHTLIPVGHAHLDTAWLWPLEITHLKMAHTTANQLRLLERYPEHLFVHSQASQYEWLEKEYPHLLDEVRGAIQRNQWEVIGSMWVEADCNLAGGEALIRQFLYGKRYFKNKLGVDTIDMWLPDVFGYSASLPQILQKFGIPYFLTQKISWNQFNKFPHNTFWWKGIDGTAVLTHFPPADTYCGMCGPKELIESARKHRDQGRSDLSLYVFGYGDGGGGPTEKQIEFLRRARHAPGLPAVESGIRVREFFPELRAKSKDLMTWSGELYFELHRGTYTSQAANKKGNRECEFLLRDAEWLSCFRDDFPKAYPAAELERLWKIVLLNQFHDILPGSSVKEVYEDSDRDYAEVRKKAGILIEDSLKRIGKKFDTSKMHCPVAIFQNVSLPTQVSLPAPTEFEAQSIRGADGALPVQTIEEFGEKKVIFATPAEAIESVAVVDLSSEAVSPRSRLKIGTRRMENDQWSVRFDSNGNIASITHLDDRSLDFIEAGRVGNLFQVFDDKPLFWSAWDIDPFALETKTDLVRCESFEIVERGPVRVAFEVVRNFGNSRISQRISLGPTPGIRFDTEVDWHETDKMLKVAFPIAVNSPRATFEIQFGNVERPTHRNTSWDVARFEVPAQKWAVVAEGAHGVALLNDCKYGHDVLDNVMRLTLLRSPKAPDPTCDMGLHRFTYVLLPFFENYRTADVVASAYALNSAARTAYLEKHAGERGLLPRFLVSSTHDVVIESVKKAEDTKQIVARLYECHNTRGRAMLSCARTVKSARLANLDEAPIAELEIVDGNVMIDYRPFEILTVLLEV